MKPSFICTTWKLDYETSMWYFNNPKIQAALLKISILWPKKYSAPWVPTPVEVVHKMLQLAKVGPDDLVYDLGCGDGRIIILAARHYGSQAVGVEIDPLRYIWCQILVTVLGLRDRVQIIYGDFFDLDLSDADVVTCYLNPSIHEKLEAKFGKELKTSARVLSKDFIFPNSNLIKEDGESNLYLYHAEPSTNG